MFSAPCFTAFATHKAMFGEPSTGATGLAYTGVPAAAPTGFPWNFGSGGTYLESACNQRAELKFFANETALPTTATFWAHDQRARYDSSERHFILDRISDLITTRSDTFLVYILVEEIEGGGSSPVGNGVTVRSPARRLVAIIDRSRCNSPPILNGNPNPNYLSPEVIARSIATW